jgi:branched-chain amino acid transport system ATP-binding protein
MALLEIKNLSKSFGERKLFENVSLTLEEGKIYSLFGANGTGKTTLFNIITGFVKADTGKITYSNISLNGRPPFKIARLGISRTFQDLRLINSLTLRENVLLVLEKKMFHLTTQEQNTEVDDILNQVSLIDHAEHKGSDLSYGQQKLLTLGCCLANNPRLLLLDEPIAGIDKENLEKIKAILLTLREEGKTVLQIEHNIEFLRGTSDLIYQIDEFQIKSL